VGRADLADLVAQEVLVVRAVRAVRLPVAMLAGLAGLAGHLQAGLRLKADPVDRADREALAVDPAAPVALGCRPNR
jgi:hypothetical protein